MAGVLVQGTNITAPVVPGSTGDLFPTHIDIYGKGGYRTVDNYSTRDGIPFFRRSTGMMIHVLEDGTFWILNSGLESWLKLPFTSTGFLTLDYENVVFTTGDQIISGKKTFGWSGDTPFYGRIRAPSGVYFKFIGLGNFISYGERDLETGCSQQWCGIPEDEQAEPNLPFDPRRILTGNKGYTSEGRTTIRIGNGVVSGAKTPIFTMWFGRTGIGESGIGWEIPMVPRDNSLTLRRPTTFSYPRLRGVEDFSPILANQTFDDIQEGGTEEEYQQESEVNLRYIGVEGTGPPEAGNIHNGGDAGGAGGGVGLNQGIGVLMLFASTAPILRFKDHYARRLRAFSVVEKGSSWPTGFNLLWGPFVGHLFPDERYLAESQLLTGTGLGLDGEDGYKVVTSGDFFGKDVRQYRTSGLYNITGKITWTLFFTGKIAGYRGDYNIEPWTGQSTTEVYPVLKRFWGASTGIYLNADQITGLLNGEYAFDPRQVNSTAKAIIPSGRYIYLAWPAASGFNNIDFFKDYSQSKIVQTVPNGYKIFLDGQESLFERSTITGVRNRYGYQEDYYLYRSRWASNSLNPIIVSVNNPNS